MCSGDHEDGLVVVTARRNPGRGHFLQVRRGEFHWGGNQPTEAQHLCRAVPSPFANVKLAGRALIESSLTGRFACHWMSLFKVATLKMPAMNPIVRAIKGSNSFQGNSDICAGPDKFDDETHTSVSSSLFLIVPAM